MPYKTHFQHERDPLFQERMREMWRNKKRRQRRKRAAAAKKAKEEGRNIYRAPDSFIRSSEFPNKALWLLDREIRSAMAQQRPVNIDLARRAFSLRTTSWLFRTKPYLLPVYKFGIASASRHGIKGGTLIPDQRILPRSSSYVDRGRSPELRRAPLAPQVLKVTVMADQQSKIDPTKPMGEAEKSFLEACAQADAAKGTPEAAEKAKRKAALDEHRKSIAKMMRAPSDIRTPREDEKWRKIDAMKKALAESETKEKTAKKEEADGGT